MDNIIAEPLGADDPREVGPFTIVGLLGAGGMGEVYLGTSEQGYAAVKRVRPHVVSRERFNREVGILYRVPPSVAPRVLAHDSAAARPWFATEYVPGFGLHEAVRLHGSLPASALRLLLAETAAQLQVVHEVGIVHHDLNPSNIMLVQDGVKLIDFGIARAADSPRLTRGGSNYGTHGFIAPEHEDGEPDAASPADVYSLGALLLYAASGRAPGVVPDLKPLRGVDAELAAIVEVCLATTPAARPTAAQLVASALELALEPPWPSEVMGRIEARRAFAAGPVDKIQTLPPTTSAAESAPRPRPRPSGDIQLDYAAEQLAGMVRRQLVSEERLRRVGDPYPLPVRFKLAESGLFDHWENIRRAAPEPLALAGDLSKIAAVFQSIPSERLVVLGGAGSGKTILALRFALDLLYGHDPGARVPVIFNLGSWNPTAVSLRDWLCRRLVRDYGFLGASAVGGRRLADALLDDDRILPVLDGFDEIAPGLRETALSALNDHAGPLLLISRPVEYAEAVQRYGAVLTAAACIELRPLALDDIDRYLTLASRPGLDPADGTVWEPVLSQLRAQPSTGRAVGVAEALGSPLMVALARAVYSDTPGRDPAELLNTERFPTTEAIQEHLLSRFVPAAYRRTPTDSETARVPGWGRRRRRSERAQHWLGYLAWHMEEQGRHDLAWWELGTATRLRSIMLVVGAMLGLVSGLFAGLVYGLAAGVESGPADGLRTAIGDGITFGLGAGLAFGLIYGYASTLRVGGPVFEPPHMRIQLRGRTRKKLREGFLPRVSVGLVGGLLFGALWAIGGAICSVAAFPNRSGPAIVRASGTEVVLGTGLGVAIGLVFAFSAGIEAISYRGIVSSPSELLTGSRATTLSRMFLTWLVITVGYGVSLGPLAGLVAGFVAGLGSGAMTAWGRWTMLARIWLPLRGHLPWAVMAFLEDTELRGVLRRSGVVYQFRHDGVQTRLAEEFRQGRSKDQGEALHRPAEAAPRVVPRIHAPHPELSKALESATYAEGILRVQILAANRPEAAPLEYPLLYVSVPPARHGFEPVLPEISLQGPIYGGEAQTVIIALRRQHGSMPDRYLEGILPKSLDVNVSLNYWGAAGGQSETLKATLSFPVASPGEFRPLANPYAVGASGSPIASEGMFVGRDELIDRIRARIVTTADAGIGVAILGQKRTGKTSIRLHLADRLHRLDGLTVVDIGNIGELTPTEAERSSHPRLLAVLLWRILSTAARCCAPDTGFLPPDVTRGVFLASPEPVDDFAEIFTAYRHRNPDAPAFVVCIDEFQFVDRWIAEGLAPPRFLGLFKSLIERGLFHLVIVGQSEIERRIAEDPNSFGVFAVERVSHLDEESARELIEHPMRDEDGQSRLRRRATQQLLELSGRNAFFIQRICYELVESMNTQHAEQVTEADVSQVADGIVMRCTAADFDNLESHWAEQFTREEYRSVAMAVAHASSRGLATYDSLTGEYHGADLGHLLSILVRDETLRHESGIYSVTVGLYRLWLLECAEGM